MAATDTSLDSLSEAFQASLTLKESQFLKTASYKDLLRTINTVQLRQDTQRELKNMTRIEALREALAQLETVAGGLTNKTDQLGIIWGCVKILDGYEQIGNVVPRLQEYPSLIEQHSHVRAFIALMFEELLDLHYRIALLFAEPTWRQTFRSSWDAFVPRLNGHVKGLLTIKEHIDDPQYKIDCLAAPAITFNLQQNIIAGNNYERIDVNDGSAHIGDQYLTHTPGIDTTLPQPNSIGMLTQLLEEAKFSREQYEKAQREKQYAAVRDWIAGQLSVTYQEDCYTVHESYVETGGWILANDKIANWINEDIPQKPIVWMHGVPGAGKTVLASIIINACQKISDVSTCYFYCRYDDPETCTSISVLKGLLMHAIQHCDDLIPYFNEQQQRGGEPILSNEKKAMNLLQTFCRGGNRKYLIIDGLDECAMDQRKSILSSFSGLIKDIDQRDPGKVRLLIVSQDEPDIAKALVEATELRLRTEHNQDDIKHYVEIWAEKIKSRFTLNEEQKQHIAKRTCWQANGQFLFAKLVMSNLFDQVTLLALLEELKDSRFPKELSEAYERIIERIRNNTNSEDEWRTTWKVLGWITRAARPLKWHELQGAISIDPDEEEVNFDLHQLRRHIRDICGALVSVSEDRVSLVHSTARRYISQSRHIDAPVVDCNLATLCIQYLSFSCFNAEISEQELQEYVSNGYFAFGDYATAKWQQHFRLVVDSGGVLSKEEEWESREIFLQELCDAVQFFVQEYDNDLDLSKSKMLDRESFAQSRPQFNQLLSQFEDAEANFQLVWSHLEWCRFKDPRTRSTISLERLRLGFERMREFLENMLANKTLSQKEREELVTFYGDRIFRCSRTTCFYFHEGFTDRTTRKRHVDRHDRAFLCSEPDCDSAEFGFVSKRDLENHIQNFHPDIEMKANLFETAKPTIKSKATYECSKCDKSFVRNAILKDHELTHTGQKPYECSRCGKAFTRKNDRDRHEKIHDNRRK